MGTGIAATRAASHKVRDLERTDVQVFRQDSADHAGSLNSKGIEILPYTPE